MVDHSRSIRLGSVRFEKLSDPKERLKISHAKFWFAKPLSFPLLYRHDRPWLLRWWLRPLPLSLRLSLRLVVHLVVMTAFCPVLAVPCCQALPFALSSTATPSPCLGWWKGLIMFSSSWNILNELRHAWTYCEWFLARADSCVLHVSSIFLNVSPFLPCVCRVVVFRCIMVHRMYIYCQG